MLEHRCSRRIAASIEVAMSRVSGGKPQAGVIRNISADGVFVETAATLRKNGIVELRFTLADGHRQVPFKSRAMVIHVRAGGVGLMFDRPLPALAEILDRRYRQRVEKQQRRTAFQTRPDIAETSLAGDRAEK